MIECEKCGRYFHSDDINDCPKCGIELCEYCYEIHVGYCLAEEDDDEEDDEKLPGECSNCGQNLVLDVDYDTSTLYCEDCDFEMDVTQQLASVADELEDNDE